jgi:GT2 family glycosyltransferase
MKISVVIVSWNAKSFLLNCLDSVLPQSSADELEVIVVDNASSDGSPEAVRNGYPTVCLIANDDNYGFAKANNIGIRSSRGEYLFLINSDVVVGDHCFARSIQYMDQHPDIGMLGPRIVGIDGNAQRSCMGYPSLWNTLCRALALDSLFPRSRLFGGRFFFYGEDVDWCRRFNRRGWKVVFFSEAEALHYGGASSATAPLRFVIEMQRANYQYWTKHHSRIAAYTFLLINLLHHTLRIVGEVATYPVRRTTAASQYKIQRGIAAIKWIVGSMERLV